MHVKAGVLEQFLLEKCCIFVTHLFHEYRRNPERVSLGRLYPFFKILPGDVENTADLSCVECFHLAGCNHDVVGRLVVYHDLPVPVKNQASGRVYNPDTLGIAQGELFVRFIKDLDVEQPGDVYQANQSDDNSKNVPSVSKLVHLFPEYKKLAQNDG